MKRFLSPKEKGGECVIGSLKMFLLLFFIVFVVSASSPANAADPAAPPATSSLIVKVVSGLSQAQTAEVIARNGGVETSSVAALRLHVVEVPSSDLPATLLNYQSDPQVESVEENQTRKVETISPPDPLYGDQWYLSKIGWDSVYGVWLPFNQATVALLDTGVDASHPDLSGNIVPGTSVIDGSGGNIDPNGHGTFLAGIVAAVSNDTGVAGTGYSGVRIMPVTVLGADGTGKDADIIAGIMYAVDHGANVILMGFSNAGYSQNLQDAIDYAWSKDVVLVAATGNDSISVPTFPAGNRGVMGVSATDAADALASFSNYGTDVFISAPGTGIITTGLDYLNYTVVSGTSASSAIVAGVAAFMRAYDATLINGVVVGRLAVTADAAGASTDETGNGRVNMAKAISDTSYNPIQPSGAAPVGTGGPYIGPYTIAGNSSISGTVRSSSTGNPIQGATVTCTSGSNVTPPPSTTTNSAGNFAFSGGSKISFSGTSGTLTFTASATGYDSNSAQLSVSNGGVYNNINFTMTPACTAPSITGQPASRTATVGDTVGFSVTAVGTASLSYQWRKNSSNITGATGSSYTILSATVSDAGNYDVVISNACGSVTSDGASLAINKATPTIIWDNPTGITYGTALSGTQLNATASVQGTFAYTPPEGTKLNAGAGQTLRVAFTPTDTANYNNASKDVTIDVAKATASVTPNAASKTYGDAEPTLTGTLTGFLDADGVTAAYSRTTGETVSGGPYTISATLSPAAVLGNYNITYNTASFTISPRAVTVTADAKSKIYGSADPALTYRITSDKKLAYTDSFTGGLTRLAGENVGTYAIQKGTLALNSNYELSYVGADLTISKRPVTVTADAKSKVYGNDDPTLTYQITSDNKLAYTDSFTGALSCEHGNNVGSYPITQGTLALSSNYELSYVGANLTITPRAVTVTADAKTKFYGDADPALTYNMTSGTLVTGDSISGALTRLAGENVGTYSIQQGTLSLNSNYAVTYVGANLTIIYNFGGFLDPVSLGWLNGKAFKQGSTIPVKFQIPTSTGYCSTATARLFVVKYSSGNVTGDASAEALPVTEGDTGSTCRYDTSGNQYIYNLSTKGLSSNTSYQLLVQLDDKTVHQCLIYLK